MSATAFTTVAPLEVESFGKAFVAFGGVVVIFTFYCFIFIILVEHEGKFNNFEGMLLIVSKYLIPKGFRALAFFPFVFVRDFAVEDMEVLINHERIHLRQQLELLVLPFFVVYVADYLVKLLRYRNRNEAYRNIVFEREAYSNEKDLDYLKSRSFWRFVKYV